MRPKIELNIATAFNVIHTQVKGCEFTHNRVHVKQCIRKLNKKTLNTHFKLTLFKKKLIKNHCRAVKKNGNQRMNRQLILND